MKLGRANLEGLSRDFAQPPEYYAVDLPDDYCPQCERPEWECECEQGNDQ